MAKNLAKKHGLDILGEVIPDSNIFHMKPERRSKRSIEQYHHHVIKKILESSPDVSKVEQEVARPRVKRTGLPDSYDFYMKPKKKSKKSIQEPHHVVKKILEFPDDVSDVKPELTRSRVKRSNKNLNFNDPYWSKMWYLNRLKDLLFLIFPTAPI